MKNKQIKIGFVFILTNLLYTSTSFAQEGFYTGLGWNTYFAKEQISSADKMYQFTHSNASTNNGFLTQSLGDYGIGIQLGIRKNINMSSGKNLLTLDAQYYYNYQDVKLESNLADFKIETTANYNHGFRFALGHHFGKVHPYLIVQAFYQNITSKNSFIDNGGIIYDVEDDGTILPAVLDDNGGSFTNDVFSFLGGFGLEIPLNKKFTLNIEYVPTKLVEYGMRDKTDPAKYFVNNLTVNQLQVNLRYYFADIFKNASP